MAGSVARAIAWVMRPRGSGSLASPGDPRPPPRCVAVRWAWAVPAVVWCRSSTRRCRAYSTFGDASRWHPTRVNRAAFHRVLQRTPLRRHIQWSPLQTWTEARVSARGCHASRSFRPRGLVTTSTVFSSSWGDGHLAAHRRPWGSPGCGPRARHACRAAMAFPPVPCPPEPSPPAAAVLASPRGRAPLSFLLPRQPATSRPCSTGESVAASRRCRRDRSLLSWASPS
jgi:hypothetical protein